MLAIDELHLVSEWRESRPDYFALGVLRSRLPDGIPFLGTSATLDPRTLKIVKESCAFDVDTVIMKTSLDRPEIYLQVVSTSMPLNGMVDLQHVLPAQANVPFDIPKKIIFIDSIQSIRAACSLMRVWTTQLGYPTAATK